MFDNILCLLLGVRASKSHCHSHFTRIRNNNTKCAYIHASFDSKNVSMGQPGRAVCRSKVELCRSRLDICRSRVDVCRSKVNRIKFIFQTICNCQKLKIFGQYLHVKLFFLNSYSKYKNYLFWNTPSFSLDLCRSSQELHRSNVTLKFGPTQVKV